MEPLADWERELLYDDYPPCGRGHVYAPTTPNGLDSLDMKNLDFLLRNLDANGTIFTGTAEIRSNDRTIKVRVWHDSEVHRLSVITS